MCKKEQLDIDSISWYLYIFEKYCERFVIMLYTLPIDSSDAETTEEIQPNNATITTNAKVENFILNFKSELLILSSCKQFF